MRIWHLIILASAMTTALLSCGGAERHRRKAERTAEPPPDWVSHIELEAGSLCGIGVAGAAFDEDSPYPKALSKERAVKNLAGVIETVMHEAIIDKSTHRGTTVEMSRVLTVEEGLIEAVAQMAETEFWLDVNGVGPFAQNDFTYAHACIDARVAADELNVDAKALEKGSATKERITPAKVPSWVHRTGKQPGGRLCAVGFSLPTFHPDKTFVIVVEDVRAQVARVLETLVSSYYEELSTDKYQVIEAMTVATTEALSKGAVVTDFWYDRDGIGPYGHKRTTYGWGCVYPVDVMLESVQAVEEQLPEEEEDVIAKVRERARNAFDELDQEIGKRESEPVAPAPPVAEPQLEPQPELELDPVLDMDPQPQQPQPEPDPDVPVLMREAPAATPW